MTLDEITYKINGCAMKVHNTLGNGFQEVIYQRCLAIELRKAGLAYDFPIGLLINFGAASLQFKKVFNSKYNPVNPKILQS
jgi:hypothetical protein